MADVSPTDPHELHSAYRYSGLARPVDPNYPTNKAVLILVPSLLVLGAAHRFFVGGADLEMAALAGLNLGLLGFICWALTRELSPDDNPAAFVAMALAVLAWLRVGNQSFLIPAVILMDVRLVNRSTGKAAEISDSVIVTLGIGAMTWFVSWSCAVVGALALILDALLPCPGNQPTRRRHLGFALALVVVAVVRVVVGAEPPRLPAHLPVFATIAGLCALAVILYPRPRSVGDVDGMPLSRARVRAGLGVGLLATVLVSVDGGVELMKAGGLWACILAVPLGLVVLALRRR
jgi:hypothetical protein